MPLDAIYLSALTRELNQTLAGCKVDKIHQPERDQILLQTRGPAGNLRLLLCASAQNPRLHLLSETTENPQTPPMFCMLLRKHLAGARLLSVTQLPFERVVFLEFEGLNELFEVERRKLVLEIMSRQSNLIFCDSDNRIISALRYTELSEKAVRNILPGAIYQPPVPQEKAEPVPEKLGKVRNALLEGPAEKLDGFLVKHIAGISPLVARELSYQTTGETDTLLSALTPAKRQALADALDRFFETLAEGAQEPYLLEDEVGKPVDFTYLPIRQYGSLYRLRQPEGFSRTVEEYFTLRDRMERMHRRTADLQKLLLSTRDRLIRKLGNQKRELADSTDREKYRIYGELLTANLGQLERGRSSVQVQNYYEEDLPLVTIPLDVKLSPAKNAQRYFTLYQKAKNAQGILEEQIHKGADELEYVETVLDSLTKLETERETEEIRAELIAAGIIRSRAAKKGAKRMQESSPIRCVSDDGFEITVGKNNTQNDLITLRSSDKDDLWLHVQNGPGSHVVISAGGREIPDRTVTQAAALAAYYSKAQTSGNVAVCYTKIRYVKKPAGAKPGKVIYKNYQTAFVTPDEQLAHRLRVK